MSIEKTGIEQTPTNPNSERPKAEIGRPSPEAASKAAAPPVPQTPSREVAISRQGATSREGPTSREAAPAREGVQHVKDVAFDSLRHAKDHAFESLSESVDQVSQRARRVGHTTSDFVATHAIPLTLLGAGAGWLLVSMSHHRRRATLNTYGGNGRYRGYGPGETLWDNALGRAEELTERAGSAVARTGQRLSERAHDLQAGIGDRAAELRSQVANGASYVGHEAAELGRQAYDGVEWAGTRAIEVTERNPLTVGLVALAAGAAVAMMLPASRRENELLGSTRDRLLQGAQRSVDELKSSVQRGANDVREVIDEIRNPGSSQHA